MILLPSSTETESPEAEAVVDEGRTALLEAMQLELGDALVDFHLAPRVDLTVRIASEAWADTASYLRERQRFRYFGFLSGIDWLPSPFGRSMDAVVDNTAVASEDDSEQSDEAESEAMTSGLAGGDTRFQVLARVHSLTTNLGVTLKCDVPEEDLTVGSWVGTYPGANWHERETWEMFGINFSGHPGLRALYLPGDFEGNPLRKDFPLLARIIKPWPGIVDVELMPEAEAPPEVEQPGEAAKPVEAAPPEVQLPAEAGTVTVPQPAAPSGAQVSADEPIAGSVELGSEATMADPDPSITAAPEAPDDVEVVTSEFPASPLEQSEKSDTSGIPAHLLDRSKQAKDDKGGDA